MIYSALRLVGVEEGRKKVASVLDRKDMMSFDR